jgi:RHS repeat-associated protein
VPGESFSQSWTWNALGDLGSITYPACQFAACVPVARSILPGYTNGFLTSVPGWATLSYHANGMVNQITHSNGVADTQANDPDSMRRPSLISSAKGTTTLWSSGTYAYDGTGNVVKTGSGYYLYDRVSRLLEGHVYDGATGGGTQKWQSYSYDPFGNILAIGGTSGRSTPTSAATNRLNGTGTSYDAAGNLTAWNGNTYQYDGFNQMIRMKSGAEDWAYIYTAGDERFWSYRVGGGGSLWALRDLDGKILREYEAHTSWSTFKDYIYRGSQLLASTHPTEGTRHLHLDHLGTPRLVTAGSTGGDFFTLTPCRVLDTRDQSAPLTAGETRTVPLAGVCGIPSSATSVSINITAVDATAQGEMTAWPANEPQPVTSAISYQASLNRANNGILKLGNGALAFYANQLSGTVHLIIDVNGYFTEPAGAVVAYHVYYPFGEEATAFNQDTEQMKFTGHERDLAGLAGAGDDLDYMHARHCSPFTGRFLSIDSMGGSSQSPQSWNRYAYARGNPLKYIDPNGLYVIVANKKDRAIVAYAYAHSASFRVQFDLANRNTNILVMLSSVSPKNNILKGSSSHGNTRWSAIPKTDGQGHFRGAIESIVPPGPRERMSALYGHELTHANELAQFGDIRKAPGARENPSSPGDWETTDAQKTERDVTDDLRSAGDQSLASEDQLNEAFRSSTEWSSLSEGQRQQCLSDLACLTLAGSGVQNPHN